VTVYVGKNVQVIITYATEGDMGSYLAQEVTFEPKQETEGIDALNSDTIQAWVRGLKTYEGTIKEALKAGAEGQRQLQRCRALNASPVTLSMKLIWDGGTGAKITVELTDVIFPEISVSSPKNAPAQITSRFRARTASLTLS